MPTAVRGTDEYHADSYSHSPSHTRPSSQSHPDLPDTLQHRESYSPTRSAGLLPALTYVQQPRPGPGSPVQSRARGPSISNNLSKINTALAFSPSRGRNPNNPPSSNPDDYYRPYPESTEQTNPGIAGLHQDAIRPLAAWDDTRSQSRAGSNGSYSTHWSVDDPRDSALPPHIPGLKSRKSSVKNLVAQINASSSTEVPPIPSQAPVAVRSTTSPGSLISSSRTAQFDPSPNSTRKYSYSSRHTSFGQSQPAASSSTAKSRRPESHSGQKRPLFGEILPSQPVSQSAGYGIINPRRRTASESSPMHSPNPMFPSENADFHFTLSSGVYTPTAPPPSHRRANSDMLNSPSNGTTIPTTTPVSGRRPPIASRIPVSTRRLSTASDSGNSTPASRAASALGIRQPAPDSTRSTTKTPDGNRNLRVDHSKGARITSPGARGKHAPIQQIITQPGAKSPSLRANIIAPPPKISPPLRSSRPRLPVSSASTAASRARVAEKVAEMQKRTTEKSSTTQRRRIKPPELTDVDFDARRLRITQALTRSREDEELKARLRTGKRWNPPSRATSPRPDSSILPATSRPQSQAAYSPNDDAGDDHDQGYDRALATQNALDALQQGADIGQEDAPAREPVPASKPTVQVQTQYLDLSDDLAPMSAVTDVTTATEATVIDPEPQDENAIDAPSLLNHVMQIRSQSPVDQYEESAQSREYHDDRADVESVNLVFRNTTYLDDDEAISKGYRTNFVPPEPLLEEDDTRVSDRDSWTSSLHEDPAQHDDFAEPSQNVDHAQQAEAGAEMRLEPSRYDTRPDSYRDTMASDAYTIINIVLQEHSSSGVVDQQFADNLYQRVLETCPEIEDEGAYDTQKIEELCLQEIRRHDESSQEDVHGDIEIIHEPTEPLQDQSNHNIPHVLGNEDQLTESPATHDNLLTLPSSKYEGHRHKSSLDSAEDWLSASPSVGDWARFASENLTPPLESRNRDSLSEQTIDYVTRDESSFATHEDLSRAEKHVSKLPPFDVDEDTIGPEEYGVAIIRAPSKSPPPPPKDDMPSISQAAIASASMVGLDTSLRQPRVPHRVASVGQVFPPRQSHSQSRPPSIKSAKSRADVTPWEVQDQVEEPINPEMVRLKKRKNIIRELVDTEFTYQRDMRVLCDIYKQTAAAALTEDDIRTLFGNVEQVQHFARDFLTALKQTSKGTDRKRERKEGLEGIALGNSSSSTLASTKVGDDAVDLQKDRGTRIGDAFEGSLTDMEVVYTEYIRNRHIANLRLEVLQRSPAAQDWLKECRDNSSDITNAWNLDALLVKPVQRVTKYPLLLKELIDATAEDHPDLPTLKRVLVSVTDINMRINDLKRHAEALDSALIRKRGQSDVRTGISKAFGRRAEKLRQHVGITEMFDDSEYDKLRIDYDNNYVQLMVVANDCQHYEKGMTQWVDKMVQVAAAAEGWVDVGHSHHQQEESKLRHLAMIIRNVQNIALPDHLEHLQKKVIKPMLTTIDILSKFKEDPKGLLHKRDKRLVDYAQMRNKKDKGEKVDKKMMERMDQWEALNTEAKERMRKLLRATAHLVQTCQGHLVQLQMAWMALIQQKFASVMGINLNRLSPEDIEKDWQVDFDYQEASALALSICNGALMLQAANMTSFLTPGSTTLNGEESPRQMSFSSGHNKRSISLNSEGSTVPTLDFSSRPSGTYSQNAMPESHFDRPYPYPNGRTRAVSSTSGTSLQRPELTSRASSNNKHISAGANFARPGTSPTVQQEVFPPPRLSVDTHSPLLSSFQTQQMPNDRPASSSTFFSAAAGPSTLQPQRTPMAGVFSSALPMSDSPVQERQSSDTLADPKVLFTAASVYEFNIDRARREAGFPYLTYVAGEIFDVIGERGELWLAKNQDDPQKQVGWIWNKHFAKLAE